MRSVVLILAFLAFPALAANVYKCKGATGELIYQNLPCPNGAKPIARGSYAPVADDPRQAAAAAQAADRLHERDAMNQTAAQPQDTYYDVSGSGSANAAADQKQNAEYQATLKRWGKRMAGPPPPGYVQDPPRRDTFDKERLARDAAPKPARIQTCNPTAGSNVTCFGSDGSISNGHVDEAGRGTMFGSDGSVEQMHGMPNRDGSCVRDINGFCN